MSLSAGSRLGPYEILGAIGAGGMGEVYRARDHKLHRDVAVKVLPEAFASDPERLARFEREARTLAALNHPNIAAIFAIEDRAIVMELVQGEDLAARIARGAIPIADALPIARQIAMALETAHESGVVHRDLKPANVKVRSDDTVKVLDFGLAKLVQPDGSSSDVSAANSPTMTGMGATQQGIILGTAAYMSPEQARGKAVDRRSDVWAFGCVLYEMLTGHAAFAGDNVTDTLAAIVRGEPDWTALPADTPASVRRLLKRCLMKDRAQRLADISTARLEIDEASQAGDAETPSTPMTASSGSRYAMLFAGLAGGALIAGGAAWALRPAPTIQPPVQLALDLPAGFRPGGNSGSGIALSGDGQRVAQIINDDKQLPRLMIRRLDAPSGTIVPDSDRAYAPFFSPDGKDVGFFSDGRLMRVPVEGGAPFRVAQAERTMRGGAWASDGFIYVGSESGLQRVPASGGTFETIVSSNPSAGDIALRFPVVLPNGRGVLVSSYRGALEQSRLAVVDLQKKEVRALMDQPGTSPRYLANGQIVFLRTGDLLTVPFDVDRMEVTGTPQPILSGVAYNSGGAGHFDVSMTGTLAFVPSFSQPITAFVWMDRNGRAEPIAIPQDTYRYAALSPDGSELALVRGGRDAASAEIVIWNFAGGRMRPLRGAPSTFANRPVWTPDGRSLVFADRPDGVGSASVLFKASVDGAGQAVRVGTDAIKLVAGGGGQTAGAVTKDGGTLFYGQHSTAGQDGIYRLQFGSPKADKLVDGSNSCIELSPNEDYLAYLAGGRVLVRPTVDSAQSQWQVSADNSGCPIWAGGELFFETEGELLAASVNSRDGFANLKPRALFRLPASDWFLDATRDAQKFLFIRVVTTPVTLPQIILNWPVAASRR